MVSDSSWSLKNPEDSKISKIWENGSKKVKVSRFEDGTWDTFLDDRLIENYDTEEEAIERARKIIEDF